MRTRQLSDLLNDIRVRTNQESSTFVSDAELTEYLNQSLAELYRRVVAAQGAPHYRASSTITVVPGTALYTLPTDFWQVQDVEANIAGTVTRLRPFMHTEHAPMANPAFLPFAPVRYRVQANQIEFLPATMSFTATLFYTPACPRLVLGTDTFDGFNGYEIAAIYDVCATVLQKEESDPSFYIGQRERVYRELEAMAAQRDASEPERIQDVTGWY